MQAQTTRNLSRPMDRLTSGQRKLIYLGGIVLLLWASIKLGAPATDTETGGILPTMRVDYDLGESTLGNVDPSSATMNLVLLGQRGIAADVLWMSHEELKRTKNWGRMRATADSIITLQPHFLHVWRYHGWDLAFNVSAQWDDVKDRYFWVKEGTKFTMRGADQNQNYAELPWDVGRCTGHKIGRSDEWRFFRKYFLSDPDPKYDGKPDPALNPEGQDNYEVARTWYTRANKVEAEVEKEKGKGQHQMMRELFRHYPERCLFDMADALHREGTFGERSREAWDRAYDEWANKYGKERFISKYDGKGIYWLNPAKGDIDTMLKEDKEAGFHATREDKAKLIVENQNVTNYRYWLARGRIEKDAAMVNAHRLMYEGRQEFKRGDQFWSPNSDPPDSVKKLQEGLELFEKKFQEFQKEKTEAADDLTQDDNLIEEAMLAIYYLHQAYILNDLPIPEKYPMKSLWDKHTDRIPEIEREFKRDLRGLAD